MNNDFSRTIFGLGLLAATPEARALRSRLEDVLDNYRPSPTHGAALIAFAGLLGDVLASAPPEVRGTMTDCVVQVLAHPD
jgi:hypothetical protein